VLRRILGRMANRILSKMDLELIPVAADLDSLLLPGPRLDRMFSETAAIAVTWLSSQKIFEWKERFDVEQEVRLFFIDYLASPFRNPRGGSRIGNLLWLNLIAKSLVPDLIVDSGTYTGASAWALARGNPRARILSFDLDMSRLKLRASNVEYIEKDWTGMAPSTFHGKVTLGYFDDHVDQCRRIEETFDRGIRTAIFDDDYAISEFAPMAHGGLSLPKVSFLFDQSLSDGEVIRWHEGGKSYRWRACKPELDRIKALIRTYERLPNAALPFGIDQLPYSVAALAEPIAAI
jgi:hypothetical protein